MRQVHAATLRDSGKEVVLKVLKPEVTDALTADLNALLTREFEGPAPWEHPRARGGLGVSARANMTFA